MMIEFPKVFTDKQFRYREGEESIACADGLIGWAYCMSGIDPPEHFGEGMVEVSRILGVSAIPSSLEKYADKLNETNSTAE